MSGAKKALAKHDGAEVDGFNIGLRFAEDRPPKEGSGGGFRGGSRGRGGRGKR